MKIQDKKKTPFPPVFLVGARCAGKSTVGRGLAAHMGLAHKDTDAMVVEKAGMSIAEIVAVEGWPAFRERERLALEEAAHPGNVISTGGGMVLDEGNRILMQTTGIVCYLSVPVHCLCERFANSRRLEKGQRPSLTGADPLEEFAEVVRQREALYRECAHHAIDASRPLGDVIAAIARIVRRTRKQYGVHP